MTKDCILKMLNYNKMVILIHIRNILCIILLLKVYLLYCFFLIVTYMFRPLKEYFVVIYIQKWRIKWGMIWGKLKFKLYKGFASWKMTPLFSIADLPKTLLFHSRICISFAWKVSNFGKSTPPGAPLYRRKVNEITKFWENL